MAFIQGTMFSEPLMGTPQNDLIFGYGGGDIITGGLGADLMLGGTGSDQFIYTNINDSAGLLGMDVIADFEHGIDKINLVGIDANVTTMTNDPFTSTLPPNSTFTNPGQLTFVGNTLYGNVDTDNDPDFAIQVVGTADFTDVIV